MAQRVASIFAEIGLDAGDFDQGASTLSGAVDSLIGAVGNIHPAAAIAISAITALGQFMMESAKAAEESEIQMAKVEAVIKATGGAAGITADEINDLSGALSQQTGVDDELIASASGVLLSFRQVGEEVFPTAMQAALDMSAVMGQDLQSSVVQLGKALNDPIAGISALSRVGVTFNEEQKKQIEAFVKQNDLASAQAVILNELQAEFGGAAEAMNNASDGSANVANAWGNLQAEIGTGLLPAIRDMNAYLETSIKGWQQFFIWSNNARAATEEANGTYNRAIDILVEQGLAIDTITEAQIAQANGGREVAYATQEQIDAALAQAESEREAANAIEETTNTTQEKTQAVMEDTEAVKMMSEANKEFLSVLEQTASSQVSFEENLASIQQRRLEIQNDIANTPAWETDKIQSYQEKLTELEAKETELTEKYKQGAAERIFALTEQRLAVDGLSDAETQYLLDVGQKLGIYTAEQVASTKKQLEESQKLAEGFKTYQGQMTAAEQEKFATSGEQWRLYTENVNTQLDANIAAVNDYIAALGDIPPSVTTDFVVNTTTNGTQDTMQNQTGGIVYNIQVAYIGADHSVMGVV